MGKNNTFNDENASAQVIIANVFRRLIRNQIEEYKRARTILDNAELTDDTTRRIIEEEPAIVVALYACVYDEDGEARRDNAGNPIGRDFIESKVLNLKANPYKGSMAMSLREIFMDLRAKMGGKNEHQKHCRRILHILRGPELAKDQKRLDETVPSMELEAA